MKASRTSHALHDAGPSAPAGDPIGPDGRRVSLIIPTLNAATHLPTLAAALRDQTLEPAEVIVIDSTSDDGTQDLARAEGWHVVERPRDEFDHGGTRNAAAAQASGSVLAFLTQDAVPAHPTWLESLVRPVVEGTAAAAYSRQVPRPDAGPLERFARTYNYPGTPHLRCAADVPTLGMHALFFSNASSATSAEAFAEVGGFPASTIVNEDMIYAARLLGRGHRVAYAADSVVCHSHELTPVQQFRRYFDIGVATVTAAELRGVPAPTSAGVDFVRRQARFVVAERRPDLLVRLAVDTAVKLVGFRLGRMHAGLPPGLPRRLSGHGAYWKRIS